MVSESPNGNGQFLEALSREQGRLRAERDGIEAQIASLGDRRKALDRKLAHIADLLDEDPPAEAPATATRGSVPDMVVALLDEIGKPMHYNDIERELRVRGKTAAGGKAPANTLLAKYSKDDRLYRSSRGTYALRKWDPTARSVGSRRRSRKSQKQ